MIVSTLEFKHPALPSGCLRYVRDNVDLQAGLETGEVAWFTAGQFEFQLPDKNMKGQEALKVAAPNTDQTLIKAIEAAKRHEPIIPIDCVYREYDTDDLSQPRNKPIKLTTTSISVNTAMISLTNSWKDLTNRRFLRRVYTTDTHQGLKYI